MARKHVVTAGFGNFDVGAERKFVPTRGYISGAGGGPGGGAVSFYIPTIRPRRRGWLLLPLAGTLISEFLKMVR